MTLYHPDLKLKNFVKVYDNVLDLDVCKNIIEKVNYSEFERAEVVSSERNGERIKSENRNCYNKALDREFEKVMFDAIGKTLSLYEKDFPAFAMGAQAMDTGYVHLLYKGSEGGTYKTHIDSFEQEPRLVSLSILLNDNFDGGNFCFFDEYVIEKKVGSALVFPSCFMFPHGVQPVSNGDRHSIVTWLR